MNKTSFRFVNYNTIQTLFVDLIQIAIGCRKSLQRIPTDDEWRQLLQMSQEQAVVGVCLAGVGRLKLLGISPPDDVSLDWSWQTVKIQDRNVQMNQWSRFLCRRIEEDGFKCCVLKGQSLARLYDYKEVVRNTDIVNATSCRDVDNKHNSLAMLRQPGDIDLWLLASHKDVIRWGQKEHGIWFYDYHHADLQGFYDAEVELHYRPTLSRNLWRNARLQRWFKQEREKLIDYSDDAGFPVPNDVFNLILVLNHNFWHLLYEGVGMRQMMDLYFVLMNLNLSISSNNKNGIYSRYVRRFGLMKFAAASMWVMQEVFGLPKEKMVCRPDEKAGVFLLKEVFQSGNFGKSDKRLKRGRYKNRMMLMTAWMKHNWRLFRYYPVDVAWTPIGVLYISMWRRWHYAVDGFMLDKR